MMSVMDAFALDMGKKMIPRRSFATVLTVLMLSAAGAEFSSANEAEGRFSMQPVDGGMLRLDTQTGAMSFCQSRDGAWACARIEDDSTGLATQLADVERKNRELRREINDLRSAQSSRHTRSETRDIIPDEKDVDRAFTFLDNVLKRFKDMVEDLRPERQGGTPL